MKWCPYCFSETEGYHTQDCKSPSLSSPASERSPEDFAYPSVEEFEKIVGHKVNEAFKSGWIMARTTNKMLGI